MPDDISIIGGGWSVRSIDLTTAPGILIGVNDSAAFWKCDFAVSMDRLWAEHRWEKLKNSRVPCWLRRSAVQNIKERWRELTVFACDHKSTHFAEDRGQLNGPHSGYCAMNLAYQMRPKRIYLFGFDMSRGPRGEPYWYPPYPWTNGAGATSSGKYSEWAKQLEAAERQFSAAGIEVLDASPSRVVTAFKKTDQFSRAKEPACVP